MDKLPKTVPPAYMPPYFIKGYKPHPQPTKDPIIPEDLRKSMELENPPAATEELPLVPLTKEQIQALSNNWENLIYEHLYCRQSKYKPRVDPRPPLTKTPPGISDHFWRLKAENFGRPPSRTKFRTARFKTQEKLSPRPETKFPLYESPSTYEPPRWMYHPEKVPFRLSEPQKRSEVIRWGNSINEKLGDFARAREEWGESDPNLGFIPENRVNFGCERIRALAKINANIVFLLVKKFVTGPPHKDIHWLSRTEAVDCWDRIVGRTKKVKSCCVDTPKSVRPSPIIPSLQSPRKKGQVEVKDATEFVKKNPKEKYKGPRIPPFCVPIPPPKLRLPWHIPPLRPRDGDDRRKKFVFDRNIDLDFIIKPFSDPYGEDRRKQRAARVKALRQAMTNDFFKRTDMDSHMSELDMILINAQQQFDGSSKARRDLLLAQILARDDFENNADRLREKEAEMERESRREARNKPPDFSHVTSRYKDVGKSKTRGVAGVL